jgi:hypothetical protein
VRQADGKWLVDNCDRAGIAMCEDFMQHDMTLKAGLMLEEVIALRLYTGPAFQKCNTHLRGLSEATRGGGAPPRAKKERHYTTTIHAIASALQKVARVTMLPDGGKVYRGMSGVLLPEKFQVADEYGCRGGVELGFLSTSTNKEQALAYIDMSKGRCDLCPLPPPLAISESLPGIAAAWQSVRVEQ